jgi:hypothetical protein
LTIPEIWGEDYKSRNSSSCIFPPTSCQFLPLKSKYPQSMFYPQCGRPRFKFTEYDRALKTLNDISHLIYICIYNLRFSQRWRFVLCSSRL